MGPAIVAAAMAAAGAAAGCQARAVVFFLGGPTVGATRRCCPACGPLGSAGQRPGRPGPRRAPAVSVDVAGFAVPPGQPATVSADVSCTVPLSDLLPWLPGLPGAKTVKAQFSSPLDPFRAR